MSNPSFASTPYSPDRLIAGDFPVVTIDVTLTENQAQGALTRGAVLGLAGGKYARVHQTGSYLASTARAILAIDADPSGGDVTASVYVTGEFNEDSLNFGGTVVADDVRQTLQDYIVFLRKPVSA